MRAGAGRTQFHRPFGRIQCLERPIQGLQNPRKMQAGFEELRMQRNRLPVVLLLAATLAPLSIAQASNWTFNLVNALPMQLCDWALFATSAAR